MIYSFFCCCVYAFRPKYYKVTLNLIARYKNCTIYMQSRWLEISSVNKTVKFVKLAEKTKICGILLYCKIINFPDCTH